MQTECTFHPYSSTGYFSQIVLDYIGAQQQLRPFYDFTPTIDGIKDAIGKRKGFATNRQLLISVLQQQYKDVKLTAKQQQHIDRLLQDNTFTVCTAHQPNIFTGYLYFIYKILHAVKLAEALSQQLNGYHFVPVYYMGSEDADLEELGHIFIEGKKYEWNTNQTGAVGRMKVDKALVQLINEISGQLLVHAYGKEIVELMRQCYKEGVTIEQATFELVNTLFADFGLLILLPDNAVLKAAFAPVMQRELLMQFSHPAVQETVNNFPAQYKVQAAGRDLNLFYLQDNSRERIERGGSEWTIVNTGKKFTEQEILNELQQFPERFSPNVILRPVFQETILPNIAFIGGGGEIAYWLELKKVFEAAGVPYPVLVLRNSFMLVDAKSNALAYKLQLSGEELFRPEFDILNALVKKESNNQLHLDKEKALLGELYERLKDIAGAADATLHIHTDALKTKALQKIEALEKKMIRAERKKFEAEQRQLHKLKEQLFPHNNLQERTENFIMFHAKEGKQFLQRIYSNSLSLEQEFAVVSEKAD